MKNHSNHSFTENDLKVVEIISLDTSISQRQIAQRAGMSLGMVNLILKRLAKTGYIKITNLNKRKMGYILTARGIAEKMARSYNYLIRAIRTYTEYRRRIEGLLESEVEKGRRSFLILGQGDLADLTEVILKEREPSIRYLGRAASHRSLRNGGVLLDCRLGEKEGPQGIRVLEQILSHHIPANGEDQEGG